MGSRTQKQIIFAASLVLSGFLTFQIVQSLSFLKTTVNPGIYLDRIAIAFACFFLPVAGGWYSLRFIGCAIFGSYASALVLFAGGVSNSSAFVWYLMQYAAICFMLFRMEQYFENQIAATGVDIEKSQSDANDLEVSYKVKGEGVSILFEKYSTYYNLRKLAEELAGTLSVEKLADIVVERTVDFISRGDVAGLALAHSDERKLERVAAKASTDALNTDKVEMHRREDLFDMWVIKNRRRLIVTDAQQDFRFDLIETSKHEEIRSLVIAPILHAGHVIGTLRIDSRHPDTFSNDDLRLLDTIAVLASSALSNAMLYEQTEQLAIKDSLTGLYVRRYFFSRLKEEHRRSLLTKRPLSMLMCDLDYFKDCNDKYGHSVGDLMLVHFTNILREQSDNGILGRFGGEEFSVMLPETPKQKAVETAEKIRKAVAETPFTIRRESIQITVSIGVASVPGDTLDQDMLVKKADEELYEAKRKGRNRVCFGNG